MHVCPLGAGPDPHGGGPVIGPGAATGRIGGVPAWIMGDNGVCVGPPDCMVKGSATVMITNKPAVRMGDSTGNGGSIVLGLPTVMIGG